MNCVNGSQAAAVLCDAPSRPSNRRACGRAPCALTARNPALELGAWNSCEAAPCGASWAGRAAACANLDARLTDLDQCPTYDGMQLSRGCAGPDCSASYWAPGAWGACNITCGGGVARRSLACMQGNASAPAGSCAALEQLPTSRTCNSVPCVGYTWQVGAWGACPVPCGMGGVCKAGVCVCQPGYRGDFCEIAPACAGILDAVGNCCLAGVVSASGACCTPGATLDRRAECCASGVLDACGDCDGPAKTVDAQGVCCASNTLDAGGFCCASGLLDECGVCDGSSTSCALHMVLDIKATQVSALLSLGQFQLASLLERFVGGVVGLNVSHLSVTDLVLAPGATISAATTDVAMRAELMATPSDSFSAAVDLRASAATRHLEDALGNAAGNQMFLLAGVRRVARTAVCGNQVCEAGERAPAANSTLGPSADPPCSGAGLCLSASGACACWVGYDGADCSLCAEGYMRSGKLCARYVRADLPLLDLQSKAGLNSVMGLGVALAVIGAAALVGVAFVAMRMRRRSRYKRAPVAVAAGASHMEASMADATPGPSGGVVAASHAGGSHARDILEIARATAASRSAAGGRAPAGQRAAEGAGPKAAPPQTASGESGGSGAGKVAVAGPPAAAPQQGLGDLSEVQLAKSAHGWRSAAKDQVPEDTDEEWVPGESFSGPQGFAANREDFSPLGASLPRGQEGGEADAPPFSLAAADAYASIADGVDSRTEAESQGSAVGLAFGAGHGAAVVAADDEDEDAASVLSDASTVELHRGERMPPLAAVSGAADAEVPPLDSAGRREVRAYADELLQTMLAELGSPAANAGPPAGAGSADATSPLRRRSGLGLRAEPLPEARGGITGAGAALAGETAQALAATPEAVRAPAAAGATPASGGSGATSSPFAALRVVLPCGAAAGEPILAGEPDLEGEPGAGAAAEAVVAAAAAEAGLDVQQSNRLVEALGPQLGRALAELGEAQRDREEHLQLYASFELQVKWLREQAAAEGAQALVQIRTLTASLAKEKEAHAATEVQFRLLYRDKYAPLKAWLAGAGGEAGRLRAVRAAALEAAEAARGQLATAQLQLRKAGLDAAAATQSIQRLEQDLAAERALRAQLETDLAAVQAAAASAAVARAEAAAAAGAADAARRGAEAAAAKLAAAQDARDRAVKESFAREEEAYGLRARLADVQREAEAAAAGKARYKAAAAAAEASLVAKERERQALETLAQDLMARQEALGART
ncbi:hypothetical protein WJX81_004003 [Elliptochloris bilobata]|uniref:EGF-like domain-containing protein n=1 Tax=Elliptochloris bilobata TaxID=381761 RepID=A0AAW1RRA1_9CHLO